MKKKKTICIDFDGVIHDYKDGWQGDDKFGEMIPGADTATEILKKKGWTVIIYTTRPATDKLKEWLKDKGVKYDYINENPDQPENSKDGKIVADIYLDDRAICFKGEWGWIMSEIAEFEPWQVREGKDAKEKKLMKSYEQGERWKAEREGTLKALDNVASAY